MKSNDDKLIREKLTGNGFPFDPQAWAQMEAMLDEKKKRRGFFWWWTGGIAAVLLLAVGTLGWGLYLMKEDDGLTGEVVLNTSEVVVTETQPTSVVSYKEEVGNSNGQSGVTSQTAEVVSGKSEANTASNVNNANGVGEANGSEKEASELVVAKNKSKKTRTENTTASVHVRSSNPRHQRSSAFLEKKQKEKVSRERTTENPFQREVEMLNAAAQKSLAENILMSRSEASLLSSVSENAEPVFDKMEEDVLPKQKKRIFNYSLGVLANVSGTTLGKQAKESFFYSKPSYMVGITHDFLFVNRVAITNSILFSQTSFKAYAPKTVSFDKAPLSYSSRITELAIPIGVKVYPVVKNNFRFYIGAGIINHIKLKETFSYVMPVDTPNPFTAAVDPFTTTPPIQTDFLGNGFPYEKALTNGLNSTEYINTNDFSINSAKRYYASFYANAGFEYVAKQRWIFFAEPQFQFTLQKIGVQDKRKYNVGLNAGFRYRF